MFGDRDYVSEAVDHALSADDASRATELVEQGGSRLLEHSQMSTLLGLIAKLREGSVRDSPQLQLFVAWASTLLQRPDPALTALERARAGVEQLAGGPRAEAQCHVA